MTALPAGNFFQQSSRKWYKFQDKYFPSPTKYPICGLFLGTRAILPLGIQGRNHHERMAYELSGAQNCYREPSVNRAWTDPLKTYYYWQKTYYYHEPSVNRAWNLRKHFLSLEIYAKNIKKS